MWQEEKSGKRGAANYDTDVLTTFRLLLQSITFWIHGNALLDVSDLHYDIIHVSVL